MTGRSTDRRDRESDKNTQVNVVVCTLGGIVPLVLVVCVRIRIGIPGFVGVSNGSVQLAVVQNLQRIASHRILLLLL